VLNNDCEIDKCETILVAQVRTTADAGGGLWGHIKSGRVWHALWLEGLMPEQWVNLRTIHQVPRALLLERRDKRLASMTADGKLALSQKIFQWMTHSVPLPPSPPAA
jgi:hypothetical protein